METSFSKSKHVVMFVGSFDNLKRFKSRLLFSQGEEFTNALDIRPHKIKVEPEPLVNLKSRIQMHLAYPSNIEYANQILKVAGRIVCSSCKKRFSKRYVEKEHHSSELLRSCCAVN